MRFINHEWIHNVIVHPLFAVLTRKTWDNLHDFHARYAYPPSKENKQNSINSQTKSEKPHD